METLKTFLNCWTCLRRQVILRPLALQTPIGPLHNACRRCSRLFLCLVVAWKVIRHMPICCSNVMLTCLFAFVQDKYGLTICTLFYGPAIVYNGQEERHKQRYVKLNQRNSANLHMHGNTWQATIHTITICSLPLFVLRLMAGWGVSSEPARREPVDTPACITEHLMIEHAPLDASSCLLRTSLNS